ncbi:HEPN domain-containing protein [Rhizobium sp. SG_E_25_P2]|uniref:HEPN domain-containing protein n=1 Tax=Rhizobium sp. SG_E_25_P2 TaxID=2879942 RepID=UPI002474F017|nr:HEPN domain-containing protein [Rhizobium sp. SG_E_25_P2]MDH6267139.1 HEPN domain-containing protein [Rhizobium sp. SG_E_25_P2]
MTPEDLQRLRVRSFLQLAKEEFDVAMQLRTDHRRQAAYFLQQSVEKLLRGVLETESVPAGTMHNIRGLADLLPKGHVLFERFLELDELSPAATRYRYPSPKGTLADFDDSRFDVLTPKVEALLRDAGAVMKRFAAGE